MSDILIQYRRERRRIQRTIRAYKKRGLDVFVNLPNIPKRITAASVRRLKKISLSYIRERSQGADYETGEVLDYGQYLRQERRMRARQRVFEKKERAPFAWEMALDHLESIISNYEDKAEKIYRDRIEQYKKRYGEEEFGKAVERLITEGHLPEPKESYNIGIILISLSYLDSLLEMDDSLRREILKSIDDNSFFEEYAGEFDSW